jgi:hypothetical protein
MTENLIPECFELDNLMDVKEASLPEYHQLSQLKSNAR